MMMRAAGEGQKKKKKKNKKKKKKKKKKKEKKKGCRNDKPLENAHFGPESTGELPSNVWFASRHSAFSGIRGAAL